MHALRCAALPCVRLGSATAHGAYAILALDSMPLQRRAMSRRGQAAAPRRAQVFDSRDAPRARFSAPECLKFSTDRGPRSPDISAPTLPGVAFAFSADLLQSIARSLP
uniref:Uncharacterized protein n=1 Tax=Oryza sativa subsp. japonica TaxID=39947 RepID=Q6K4M6_ORYSJ|nr:hypothetical protein [Oryza sativa Japonica Group]BAD19877.1 hypothetical protein [Oryza sativa Japonica Group]